jgi:hypothetical protein
LLYDFNEFRLGKYILLSKQMNWINIYYVLHMFQKIHLYHMQTQMQNHIFFQNNTIQRFNIEKDLNGFDMLY